MSVEISKINNSLARVEWIFDANEPHNQNPLVLLDNIYALHPDGYQFDPKYIKRRFTKYDGKIHLFKLYSNSIPLGLVKEVISILKKYNWNVKYDPSIFSSLRDNNDYSELIKSFCNAIEKATSIDRK